MGTITLVSVDTLFDSDVMGETKTHFFDTKTLVSCRHKKISWYFERNRVKGSVFII